MTIPYARYQLAPIPAPQIFTCAATVVISDSDMKARLHAVTAAMQRHQLDFLIIYADKEHGGNFEYLAGFIPRFEEALLVLSASGKLHYIMGNENLKLVPHARNPGVCLHYPLFSLPNQPMSGEHPPGSLTASNRASRAK